MYPALELFPQIKGSPSLRNQNPESKNTHNVVILATQRSQVPFNATLKKVIFLYDERDLPI